MIDMAECRKMADTGATAEEVFLQAEQGNVHMLDAIEIVMELYNQTFSQAQEVYLSARGITWKPGHADLLSDHASLSGILQRLREQEEVKASPTLYDLVRNAIAFHEMLPAAYQGAIEEIKHLQKELKTSPNVIIDSEHFSLNQYQQIHDAGGDPKLICRVAKADEADDIKCLKILRTLFQFSLKGAQTILREVQAE